MQLPSSLGLNKEPVFTEACHLYFVVSMQVGFWPLHPNEVQRFPAVQVFPSSLSPFLNYFSSVKT